MKSKLLIVADLGRMKAYRLEENRMWSQPRLTLLEDFETDVTQHLSEQLTDQAGRYRKGTNDAHSVISDGEQHNIDLERRRRAVKVIAKKIEDLMEQHTEMDGCYLAADSRINQPILGEMSPGARGKIKKTVTANLSKLDASNVVAQFCE